ncbi:HAMP domain-containing histidine kinase [Sulfurimonas sp. SAG-AH-194-L11]|nr:HAMP domain-containing sensor histidine kinase [Sulfurimonas sp. SAG-AH-194-L11]MDF1876298.1 HAMP domain-containing histidine kinase [Sulfurimonas sp. SAG-AH-194-L11]
MKKVEIESLLKSFTLFFISQLILVGTIFFIDYKREVQVLDESMFSQMRICSFNLKCSEFEIDFADAESNELYKLTKTSDALSAYFSIPNSTQNVLKIYLPIEKYNAKLSTLREKIFLQFVIVLFVIIILSSLFSLYTISPLRNALRLTEEFIKDILHDFNTPISTLRLNVSMLENEIGSNKKITRIEKSVQNILNLQSHLRSYLDNHEAQKEQFSLESFLQERVSLLESSYNGIEFSVELNKDVQLFTNKEAFTRIVDNILSNAAKYNMQAGSVTILFKDNILQIKDTGKGIKNPKKVFDRFYKEQERGIGIGLHIVKKFCDELAIGISLESELGVGSSFYLDVRELILR